VFIEQEERLLFTPNWECGAGTKSDWLPNMLAELFHARPVPCDHVFQHYKVRSMARASETGEQRLTSTVNHRGNENCDGGKSDVILLLRINILQL
jgi:hypothetical protein